MVRNLIGGAAAVLLAVLGGCGPSYSPNTYSSTAVQQANKVEQGEIVGVRAVGVSADATLGTVTGGAAGGIAGSQVDHGGPITALTTLGGTVVGGIVGSGVEHVSGDTTAYEYIVRQNSGDLVSVTQKDKVPLAIGQKVLVITGKQARVVPDYTVALPGETTPKAKTAEKGKAGTSPVVEGTGVAPAGAAAASSATPSPQVATGAAPAPVIAPPAGPSATPQTAAAAQPAAAAPTVPAGTGMAVAPGTPVPLTTAPTSAAPAPATTTNATK